ncbi:MAG: hypothetical protein AB1607_13185 [Chloroflexota bacterium]
MQTYRITIQLTEEEYLTLAKIARDELRAPRWQAVHFLKNHLTAPTIYNPAPGPGSEVAAKP